MLVAVALVTGTAGLWSGWSAEPEMDLLTPAFESLAPVVEALPSDAEVVFHSERVDPTVDAMSVAAAAHFAEQIAVYVETGSLEHVVDALIREQVREFGDLYASVAPRGADGAVIADREALRRALQTFNDGYEAEIPLGNARFVLAPRRVRRFDPAVGVPAGAALVLEVTDPGRVAEFASAHGLVVARSFGTVAILRRP